MIVHDLLRPRLPPLRENHSQGRAPSVVALRKSGRNAESEPALHIDSQFAILHAHPNLPERADYCIRFAQVRSRVGAGQRDDFHAACVRGNNSCRRVLDHEALSRIHPEQFCSFQVRLGIGFAFHHVVGRNQHWLDGQIPETQAGSSQVASARTDHAPAAAGHGLDQFGGTGHDDDTIGIVRFTLLDLLDFGLCVQMRCEPADDLDSADVVGDFKNFFRADVVLPCPAAPLAGTDGVESTSTPSRSKRMAEQRNVGIMLKGFSPQRRPRAQSNTSIPRCAQDGNFEGVLNIGIAACSVFIRLRTSRCRRRK